MPARAEETRSGSPGKCGALFWGEETQRKRRGEGSGACGDEVEEARAELYREQAEELRLAREGKEG